ncbi:beta-galactosidase [Bifidobacterium sp. ESL0690]|uniref:beta-galactosidase n=1 Tax=Bifidobacterium sp. ESL0690 TaxID=2983214 RepID=UPI0023F8258D|nr:beta-galactosidase [Bifidobacterium sp. ESL0690]WEV46343.1 beta-galactosidase [Bifidobacterium sp. ESL0690]
MNAIKKTAKLPDRILFGAAYYDEYMPRDLDRVDTDMEMMRHIGINTIRIAESTWSTCEPQPGVFDFSYVDRVLEAARRHGISVIVGTPTYAVPTWLVRMHPDVLAVTPDGPGKYGARQIMDIVNPSYRYYAERVIRKLIAHVAQNPAVIGYQVDNETKYYDCVSADMQALFVKYLRDRFNDNLDELNATFGLDYWSNRINAWEDFPDVTGAINESLRAEFDKFRRSQVAEYLAWQADIVREYARDDQFVTHNFDYEWRGYSFGVQPAVDHFKAVEALDITGVDIYHPTEDELTGKEIAFGGDMARSIKGGQNYFVLETEAQGQHGWLPYPGQLRLQAYSHLASGADSVMYWHWHSIHNSFETYWKGLLSHDLEPNPTYEEAGVFGREIAQPEVQKHLKHLRKRNQVAIMVSNEALTALDWFTLETGFPADGGLRYNDIVRMYYDALFELNVEADFVPTDVDAENLSQYKLVVTPALYCASQSTIDTLRSYVKAGGHLLSSLRSFVADDDVTVWHDSAPHGLTDVFGMSYNQFTRPNDVGVVAAGDSGETAAKAGAQLETQSGTQNEAKSEVQGEAKPETKAEALIELLKPNDGNTQVLASYRHPAWGAYAAITRHAFGSGWAQWVGTVLDAGATRNVVRDTVEAAGVESLGADLAGQMTVRVGFDEQGERIVYLLNYLPDPVQFVAPISGRVIVGGVKVASDGSSVKDGSAGPASGSRIEAGDELAIGPWNLVVVAEGNAIDA